MLARKPHATPAIAGGASPARWFAVRNRRQRTFREHADHAGNPGIRSMPAMPMMPMPGMEKLELAATGDQTNLLGYTCARYEIKQRGEVMEIWATDKLLPYQPWLQNQPPRSGPRMIEEQWGELLKAKNFFRCWPR